MTHIKGSKRKGVGQGVGAEWPLVKLSKMTGSSFPITAAVRDFDELFAGTIEQRVSFWSMFKGVNVNVSVPSIYTKKAN